MKQRILYLHGQGYKAPTIHNMLKEEGLVTSRLGIYYFIVHSREHGLMRYWKTIKDMWRNQSICRADDAAE